MTYEADWKKAKKTFETDTGKKKPSDSILAVFGKSSGIGACAKELDKALASKDKKKMQAAYDKFGKTYISYSKTISDAFKKEKYSDCTKELVSLEAALGSILSDYDVDMKKL